MTQLGELFDDVEAATAKLLSMRGRVEQLDAESEEQRRLLGRYEVELREAHAEAHRSRETIEQLRHELDRRESMLSYIRQEVAQISGALEGV